MSLPRMGLRYSDAARRIKRIAGNPGNEQAKVNLIRSIRNQCRLAEGEKALTELDKEVSSPKNSSPALSGAGNKQTGFGLGRRLGHGKFRYSNGKWEKV